MNKPAPSLVSERGGRRALHCAPRRCPARPTSSLPGQVNNDDLAAVALAPSLPHSPLSLPCLSSPLSRLENKSGKKCDFASFARPNLYHLSRGRPWRDGRARARSGWPGSFEDLKSRRR